MTNEQKIKAAVELVFVSRDAALESKYFANFDTLVFNVTTVLSLVTEPVRKGVRSFFSALLANSTNEGGLSYRRNRQLLHAVIVAQGKVRESK
jgi:hypothetical protein